MDAGKLDRRITLQRATTTDDGFGTIESGWTDLATVWAQFLPQSAAERAQAGERASNEKARFRIRKDSIWSDLNATDRLLFEGVAYNLVGVTEPDRGWFVIEAVGRGDS